MAGKEGTQIKGTVLLDNGDIATFYLNPDHVQILQQDAEIMAQTVGWDEPWSLATAIASSIILQGIDRMKENNKIVNLKGPEDYENETAATPDDDIETKKVM